MLLVIKYKGVICFFDIQYLFPPIYNVCLDHRNEREIPPKPPDLPTEAPQIDMEEEILLEKNLSLPPLLS